MQTQVLTLHNSGGIAISRRCSQTWPSIIVEECEGMDESLDEQLYKERYSIERANAWMDSYRSVLNGVDITQTSWKGWNYITFILIFLKKIRKREKSR